MNEAELLSASTHGSEFSSNFPTTSPSSPKADSRRSPTPSPAGQDEDEANKKGENTSEVSKVADEAEPVKNSGPEVDLLVAASEPESTLSGEPTTKAENIESKVEVASDTKELETPESKKETKEVEVESTDPISSLVKITNDQLHSSDSSSLSNSVIIATTTSERSNSKSPKDSEEEILDVQAIEEDVHASQLVPSKPEHTSHNLSEGAAKHTKVVNKPEPSSTTPSTSTPKTGLKVRSPPSVPAKIPGKNRKPTIPVGIAVAWQRNSNSTTTAATTSTGATITMSVSTTSDSKSFPKSKKLSSPPLITSPLSTSSSKLPLGNGSVSPSPSPSPSPTKDKEHKSSSRAANTGSPAKEVVTHGHGLSHEREMTTTSRESDKSSSNSNLSTIISGGAKISTPLPMKNDINSTSTSTSKLSGMKSNSSLSSSSAKSSERERERDIKHKAEKAKTIASASNKSHSHSQSSGPSSGKSGVVQNNTSSTSSNTNISSNERFSASGDGFRSLNNNNNSPYRDSWPSSQLLVPQDYAAAAAYLQHQQLSMHQTMQLQLSHSYGYNISSCIYAGYPADSLLQYEQFLRQQQQRQDADSLELAVQAARRQLLSGNGIRTPIPTNSSNSPKINIPTPSPAHLSSSSATASSLYSQHSLWPAGGSAADLYQHYQQLIPPPAAHQYHQYQHMPQHPQSQSHTPAPAHLIQQHMMTTAGSSTATLSPRSLSSATPSPITIHDSSFQSLLNRKCVTPNPTSKHFPAFSSPFSPTLVPGKESGSWRDSRDDGFVDGKLTPLPLVVGSRKKSSTISSLDDIEESRDEETDDELARRRSSQLSSPTSSMPNYKHDFRRLESLIEKRADNSMHLLSSSSESLNASYSQDHEPEDEMEEAVNLKIEKDLVVKKDEPSVVTNCDGEMSMKLVVPDESNSAFMSLATNTSKKEIKKPRKSEPMKRLRQPSSQNVDDQKSKTAPQTKAQTTKGQAPKKAARATQKEKETKSSGRVGAIVAQKPKPKKAINKKGGGTNQIEGIDHEKFDLIPKVEAKKPKKAKARKEDTQEINNSTRNINSSIKKKSGKYFTINNNKPAAVEKKAGKKKPTSGTKLSSLSSKKHDSTFVARNDSSSDRRVGESINYATADFELGGVRLTKNDQNGGNSSHDIVSSKLEAAQSLSTFSIGSPKNANSNTNTIIGSSTIYCDNSGNVRRTGSTFDPLNSSSSVYNSSSSSPISPNLQYQQKFHPVFTSPPIPTAAERRLSSHSSNSIESSSSPSFSALPTIVISPEDNHLNILATVAAATVATEEVGSYITNSPTHSRRFDIMVSESNSHSHSHSHHQQQPHDDCALRRHSTESLYAAVAAAAAAEENNTHFGKQTGTRTAGQETSRSASKHDDDEHLSGSLSCSTKALIATSSSQTSNNRNNTQSPFELKIPHVVPQLQDVGSSQQRKKKKLSDKQRQQQQEGEGKKPKGTAAKRERLNKNNLGRIVDESKQIRKKQKLDSSSSGQSQSKFKTSDKKLSTPKPYNAAQVKKEPKVKITKSSPKKGSLVSQSQAEAMQLLLNSKSGFVPVSQDHTHTPQGQNIDTKEKKFSPLLKLGSGAPISGKPHANSTSIYDFDAFDDNDIDTKSQTVDSFANRPDKSILQSTPPKMKAGGGLSATRSGTAGVKKPSHPRPRSGLLLGKKLSTLNKPVKEGSKLVKVRRNSGKDDLKTTPVSKHGNRKEMLASIKYSDTIRQKMSKGDLKDSKPATEKLKKDMNQNVSSDRLELFTATPKKQKIPNVAAAATNKMTTSTALVEASSTEISPAVGNNANLKNEVVARALPFLPQMGSHIPRTLTPPSFDPCSSNESSSSAWTTITNPTHIVSAVKMERDRPIKQEPHFASEDDDRDHDWPKSPTGPAPKRKLLLKPSKLSNDRDSRSPSQEPAKRMRLLKDSSFDKKKFRRSTSPPKRKSSRDSDFKPSFKVEPIPRSSSDEESESEEETRRETRKSARANVAAVKAAEKIKGRKTSIDMNVFSRKVRSDADAKVDQNEEEDWDENVVISGVDEMIDEMRILTEIEGLFYTGKLNALQPPDVYGVTLDNERGAPPHIIFSAEEVITKCIREAKPWKSSQLPHGLRIGAYWSRNYTGLYPGKVSTDYDGVNDLVPVEFDDGDTGLIKIDEIRLLAPNHPVAEYDPNPLLTLEKKHRKRRISSANGSQGGCTGDHEERDCGEPYCAKVAKLQEEEEAEGGDGVDEYDENFNDTYRTKMKYWTWTGLGYKIPKTKKNRHKEFFHGIQRGDEVINVGDSALFISNGNDRPFIGRIERLWEKKGQKIVNVRWYYHPEEIKTKKRIVVKYPGALFESPHIDENDVQTIAKKCSVIPFGEFKHKYGPRLQLNWKSGSKTGNSIDNRKKAPKHTYYVAGFYDPYTFKLQMKDLK